MGRSFTVGALSLVAAGVIGGGFALALSQGTPQQQPVQLRQVVATETVTPSVTTTATTAPTPEPTATTAKAPTPKPAARVQQVAPDPAPAETTPDPVTTTPEAPPQAPPPVKPGPGTLVTATCGGAGCPTG